MKLYLDSGYVNIRGILDTGMTFNFVVGGRGTGKTYTTMMELLKEGKPFIYLRRTQTQLDAVCTPELSPFKPMNELFNRDIRPYSMGKNCYAFRETTLDEDGKAVPGELVAYGMALSTFSNIRGFSAANIRYIMYDEFIPERHERPIKDECSAFLNCIETVNRNREMLGTPPVKVICLANSNDFANPLFVGLEMVKTIERMMDKGKSEYINPQRGLGIFLLKDSPISKQKAETSLYRFAPESEFTQMSLNNAFIDYDSEYIKSQNLKDYIPLVTLGELTIYVHKSENKMYVTGHRSGSVRKYQITNTDMKRFKTLYQGVIMGLFLNTVYYESHYDKALLDKYLTMGK